MGQISVNQSQSVMAILMANAAWSDIDFREAQLQGRVILDPKGAGAEFTKFLQNGCRLSKAEIVEEEDQPLIKLVNGQVNLPGLVEFNTSSFFQDRAGINVDRNFVQKVLFRATVTLPAAKASSWAVNGEANDERLEEKLPAGYRFNKVDLCARLAQMIKKQEGGTDGELATDGTLNLFYSMDAVVVVYWDKHFRVWEVSAPHSQGTYWPKGTRVFSRT